MPQQPSPLAPTEILEPISFSDLTHKFEIRIERILIGQRTVDENAFHQFQLDDFHARNKEIVYFEISLKNIDGQQEHDLSFFDFSLQDKAGNTYSCEQTTDYIRGKVLRGKTGHGGIAFAVEKGNIPTTLTYDTGYIDSTAYVVNGAQIKLFAKAYALNGLKIFKQPVGSD